MDATAIDETTEAKYRRRFEEGYDVYDPEYYKWMKYNHPVEAETWIKNVGRPMSSTGNTDQGSEVETTEKNPGPSQPSEQLKYISRFLVQAVPVPKEKDKTAPKRISGGRAFTSAECIKFLEEKEAQKQKDEEEKQKRKEERERKRKAREEERGKSKKQKKNISNVTKNVEGDVCPVCQDSYDYDERQRNGKEWIQCSCGTWVHEDCVLTQLEENGATFCPICTEED